MTALNQRSLFAAFILSMVVLLATAFAALYLFTNLQQARQTNARLLEIVRKHDAKHLEFAAYYHAHHRQADRGDRS